jgi:hypothetical protein
VERSKYEFRKTIPMGDTANRQSQQSQQSHSIHGGMDSASPQSTLSSPTSGVTHTSSKETHKHKITKETKTTHDTNPATMKSAWCCPSQHHPTPSLLHRRFHFLQTHPSREIQIRIQQNNSNGRHCQQAIATITIALDTWWY